MRILHACTNYCMVNECMYICTIHVLVQMVRMYVCTLQSIFGPQISMNVMTALMGALRSATTRSAATSAPVRMDTDWTQTDTPAMVQ